MQCCWGPFRPRRKAVSASDGSRAREPNERLAMYTASTRDVLDCDGRFTRCSSLERAAGFRIGAELVVTVVSERQASVERSSGSLAPARVVRKSLSQITIWRYARPASKGTPKGGGIAIPEQFGDIANRHLQ